MVETFSTGYREDNRRFVRMKRKDGSKAPHLTVMAVMVKFCGDHDIFDLAMIAQAVRKFDRKDRPFDRFLCHDPCPVGKDEARDLCLAGPAIRFKLVRGHVWYYACLECIGDGKGGCRQVLRILNGKERREETCSVWWNGQGRGTDPHKFLHERDLPVMAERA